MKLVWEIEDEKVLFKVRFSAGYAPFMQIVKKGEKVFLPNGSLSQLAPIFLLIEEGIAIERFDGTIEIDASYISELSRGELVGLGLPAKAPFNFEVRGSNAITAHDFKFEYEFLNADYTVVAGWQKKGCILKVGRNEFTIPAPFYSLSVAMDKFNNSAEQLDMEEKFLIWADLKELLPENAIKDDYLHRLEIRRAEAFTIVPKIDQNGQINFDPQLLRHDKESQNEILRNKSYTASLPQSGQNNFAKDFKRFGLVKSVYSLPGQVHCVVEKDLQKVLSVVKEFQNMEPKARAAFVRNPKVFINEKLAEYIDAEKLEDLFQETESYSERVREIGLWSPPIIPFLKKDSSNWFPDSEMVLKIGDEELQIEIGKLIDFADEVENKVRNGVPTIEIEGKKINAIDLLGIIDSVKAFMAENNNMSGHSEPSEAGDQNTDQNINNEKLALNVFRNLEEQEFIYAERFSRDTVNYAIDNLKNKPLAHQADAIKILQNHWQSGSPGMLMADDMGLGKTFQTLAFLIWVKKLMKADFWPDRPILLVAPTGLIQNWLDEISHHLEENSLGNVYNATRNGLAALKLQVGVDRNIESKTGFPILDLEKIQTTDVVITTYENIRDFQFSFAKIHWSVLVFDEMQKIKNPKTRMTDAAKALKADFILGLTGTPVENKLLELWCLIDTIKPCYLGSLRQFVQEYEADTKINESRLMALNTKLTESKEGTPLMLRRLKSDHLKGLPEKKLFSLEQEMGQKQANEYSTAINLVKSCKGNTGGALMALHRIKAVSLHPDMLSENFCDSGAFVLDSARLVQTFKMLDKICQEEEKALIFCESRQMQGILAEILFTRYSMNHLPIIINGEVLGINRKKKVDIFQSRSGFDVMILSPKAGGVGLTLTAANHVIHLTRWWNPAVEDQCTDRVFRIGQKKTVHVYVPKAIHPVLKENSFDCLLDDLLDKKRLLNKKTLAPSEIDENEVISLVDRMTKN